MHTVILGQSDLDVGALAYGCWRLDGTDAAGALELIQCALDAGLNLIDTADIYGLGTPIKFGGCERLLGEAMRLDTGLRKRMVLATKGGIIPPRPYDSSYDYLMGAIDASIERLGVEQVDLYQIHRPDLLAPIEETARALDDMIAAGKTRYVGVSNFTVAQKRALQAHLKAPLITTQPEFSALKQDPITDGTLDWCSETGASSLCWSPLAGGMLATGRGEHERLAPVLSEIDRIAKAEEATRTQVCLAFLMRHQASVIPIIGTQTPARIQDSASAADLQLSARDFYSVIEAYRGEAMP